MVPEIFDSHPMRDAPGTRLSLFEQFERFEEFDLAVTQGRANDWVATLWMLLEISDLILTSNAKSIVDFFSEDPVFAGQLAWYSAQLLNSRWQFTALVEASEDANDLSRLARGLSVANGLDIVVQKKIDGMRGIDDRSVDIVYAIGLLQTVPQYEHLRELLAEISRVLMPGGVILLDFYSLNHAAISTVARGDDWNLVDTLQHIVLYCDPASYGPVSAPPMYENRKLWQIDELDDLLEASGFSLERFHPIDPVSAWMTSESWNKVRDAGEEGLATYLTFEEIIASKSESHFSCSRLLSVGKKLETVG